ncbi:DUF4084 domain-containing protein [Bacillus rubiinfantis]|uniref:DUF4084 domain-containing protein n=1 Tax=Bacillus rubiinfantis TaxID=1499680 RepID=UPI0005AB0C65|nr:DUF4084 domain-containing protein [Bacillus rubiinfantis]
MSRQLASLVSLCTIIILILSYYLMLGVWKDHTYMLGIGTSAISLTGCLLATIWLSGAAKRSSQTKKNFWILLALGCLSDFFAELIWAYYRIVLHTDAPFPGKPDIFYILQIVFYLVAFFYLTIKEKRSYQSIKFFFDVAIIMTVAFTFSWHFIIRSIVTGSAISTNSLIVSLLYPVGDLAMLFGALSIYFGVGYIFSKKKIAAIISGTSILIFADSIYTWLISMNRYQSDSWIDPLFILAVLLIGFTGVLHHEGDELSETEREWKSEHINFLRLSLPYINVTVLFTIMMIRSKGIDGLLVGSGISILLVIIRQVLIIIENQQLLKKVHSKALELELSEQRYKSLFEHHPDAVYSLDLEGRFDNVNAACLSLLGYEKQELIGRSSWEFIDHVKESRREKVKASIHKGKPEHYEVTIRSKSEDRLRMCITNIPILVKQQVVGIFGIAKDITELRENAEKIKYLAYHDSLTGLPNRALFTEILKYMGADAKRNNEMFAVMYIDLDRFKMINDTLGHEAGDQLLISVSERLKQCIHETDLVSRQGGDEFTLLVKGINQPMDTVVIAQRILDCFQQPHEINGQEIVTTASIGIAIYPIDDDDPTALMRKADIAMYHVKENGKGAFRLYAETNEYFSKKLILEKDISCAISRNELFLHYQPQIETKTGRMIGVEALLRWRHPKLGLINPGEFIAIAEETGYIQEIGEWVLREACKQAKRWQERGFSLKVGINLSPRQLYQEHFVESVKDNIEVTRIDPRLIDLEITEAAAMHQVPSAIAKMQAIKQLGVKISIDDFGTGYSSFSYLAAFPIDTIKLARELICTIGEGDINQTIIEAIIELASKLKLNVIAEGVETEAQAAFLKQANCQQIQGYLYGKPMPVEAIDQLL